MGDNQSCLDEWGRSCLDYLDKPFDHSYFVDFHLPMGTDILASADGTVSFTSGPEGLRGWGGVTIAVEHGAGEGKTFTTLYCHLDSVTKQVGDVVKQGDIIAQAGRSCWDNVTGFHPPHFHYGILGVDGNLSDNR